MTAKLANWLAGVVLPLALVCGALLDSVESSRTSALADGPVELWRASDSSLERRAPAARMGEEVPFGYKVSFQFGGQGVLCVGRFSRFHCQGGWRLAPAGSQAS